MSITLNPELEQRIRAKVAAGVAPSVDAFVDSVLRRALGLVSDIQEGDRDRTAEELDQEVDRFFAAMDTMLPPDTPVLPDEAFSREAIYEGRS